MVIGRARTSRLTRALVTFAFGAFGTIVQAQDCTIAFAEDGRISAADLATAFTTCSGEVPPDQPVWAEVVDFGTYSLRHSDPDADGNRRVIGFAHTGWERLLWAQVGQIFGFRATVLTDADTIAAPLETTISRMTSDGEWAQVGDVSRKAVTPGAVELIAYQITTDDDLVPGLWRIQLRLAGHVLAAQSFETRATEN